MSLVIGMEHSRRLPIDPLAVVKTIEASFSLLHVQPLYIAHESMVEILEAHQILSATLGDGILRASIKQW
jgi:hypothetical protein